jgi:hypothetical protein
MARRMKRKYDEDDDWLLAAIKFARVMVGGAPES